MRSTRQQLEQQQTKKQSQHMVEKMLRMMKDTRKKPDTDVDLDDDSLMTNRPPAGPPRWLANTVQELDQTAHACVVYRKSMDECAKEQHSKSSKNGKC